MKDLCKDCKNYTPNCPAFSCHVVQKHYLADLDSTIIPYERTVAYIEGENPTRIVIECEEYEKGNNNNED